MPEATPMKERSLSANRRTCRRKKAFPTQAAANRMGLPLNQRAYLCPVCHCWHLTSDSQ